jgi:thiosulfate/3-mercaptopyruvate sulfurtransferase
MTFAIWMLALLSYARPELLITTDWLAAHLDDPNVRIVDTRMRGYDENHIPGAVRLDITASRDKDNPPTFLPELDTFVAKLEALGISNDTRVIFYDDRGGIYGTRPWVVLQLIGHDNAAILDGGWPKWTSESRPKNSETPDVPRGTLTLAPNPRWVVTADDVASAIDKPGTRILDTRSEEEFAGIDLRSNPRGGAIPSSTNLNWQDTLEGEFQSFKPADELTLLFESYGLSTSDDIITYCQGAGRAAHELFVLYLMGYDDVRLYLGSMEDWSRQKKRPLQ